jgi:hypothetical protein
MATGLRRNMIVAAATGGLLLAGAAVAFAAIPNETAVALGPGPGSGSSQSPNGDTANHSAAARFM